MSFFFGGKSQKVKPQYTGLQTQTSSSTMALALLWGANRIAPNLIWYGDFASHKHKQKAGKGGGKATTYTYSASVMMALCDGGNEGIHDVRTVYRDNDSNTTWQSMGFSLFKGTMPQAGWGYLQSKHPDQYRKYPGVAYLAIANYDLGQSNSLPNHSFEVLGRQYKTAHDGSDDAEPAKVIDEFLTYSSFGVGFDQSYMDQTTLYSQTGTTTGDASLETYCAAMSFSISPFLSDQTAATDVLDNWTQALNTAVVWTGYSVKLIPYDLSNIDGNGFKYRPIQNALVTVDDTWFISDKDDPVKGTRSAPEDAYNQLTLTYSDRSNDYNSKPADYRDQGLIDQFGLRPGSSFDATKFITRADMATKVVAIMGQKQAYKRNSYTYKLPSQFIIYEPMDLMTIIDKKYGTLLVQITDIEEADDNTLTFTVDEIQASVASNVFGFTPPTYTQGGQQTGTPPGPVNPPLIFDVPANLSNGNPEVWAAVSGGVAGVANPYWGGCYVYISTDNATFTAIGEIDSAARLGKTTSALAAFPGANPDTETLGVDLSMSYESELTSVSEEDMQNGATLSYVGGEFISYENATLTAANKYDLTPMFRGLYQSTPGAHAAGVPFARLDENIFRYQLPADYIGKTLYFKFQSFNIWQTVTEDLADCATYTYVPTGLGFQIAAPTSTTLSFALDPTGTTITGTVTVGPSVGPYLDHYDAQVTSDGGATWVDVNSISSGSTKVTFPNALAATNYKARTRAVSAAANGTPSNWVESAVVNTGTISGTSKPNPPTAFAGTGGTLSNSMHWTPAVSGPAPQGYKIYEYEGHSSTFSDGHLVGTSDVPTYTRSGLDATTEYTYWLTAYNAAGESTVVGPIYLTTTEGGGGGDIEIDWDGAPVLLKTRKLNFTGGVTLTQPADGEVDIDVEGGGGSGGGGYLRGYTRCFLTADWNPGYSNDWIGIPWAGTTDDTIGAHQLDNHNFKVPLGVNIMRVSLNAVWRAAANTAGVRLFNVTQNYYVELDIGPSSDQFAQSPVTSWLDVTPGDIWQAQAYTFAIYNGLAGASGTTPGAPTRIQFEWSTKTLILNGNAAPTGSLTIQQNGVDKSLSTGLINFTGVGVSVTGDGSGNATVEIDSAVVPVSDEGTIITIGMQSLNFVGDGVEATADPEGNVTVTIDGGGGGTALTVSDGTTTVANVSQIDVDGGTVSDEGSGHVKITITGGGSGGSAAWKATATGTGSAQNITLPATPDNEQGVLVFVNGLRYTTDQYSISGTTLTLTTNAAGDIIEIVGELGKGSGGGGSSVAGAAIATLSATQSLPAGTDTLVSFSGTLYDTLDFWSASNPTRLTVPSGVDYVRLTAQLNGSNQTGQVYLELHKNGALWNQSAIADTDTSGADSVNVSTGLIPVVEGDYFELDAFSDNARDILATTWFSIEAVSVGGGGGSSTPNPDLFQIMTQQVAQQIAKDGYKQVNESYFGFLVDCGGLVGFALYQNMKDAAAGPTKSPTYTVAPNTSLMAIMNKQSDALINNQSYYHGGMYANGVTNKWVFTWGSPAAPLNGAVQGQYGGLSGTGYGGNSADLLWPHAVGGDSVYLQLYTNGDTNRASYAMIVCSVLDASGNQLPITDPVITATHS